MAIACALALGSDPHPNSNETHPMYIVTGATMGIGRAVAVSLAQRGLGVVATGRSGDSLAELREQFPDYVVPVIADLSKPAGIDQVVDAIPTNSTISGVVHSAGSLVSPESYQALCTDSFAPIHWWSTSGCMLRPRFFFIKESRKGPR